MCSPLSVRYRFIEMPAVVILYNINYHVEFVSWRGPRLSVDHSTGPQGRALSLPPDRKQVVSETKEANAQITSFFQSSPLIILMMEIYKELTPRLKRLTKIIMITHIMYMEVKNAIRNLTKANT